MSHIKRRDVVVFGSGGLGREVLWSLRHPDMQVTDFEGSRYVPNVVGFADDNAQIHGEVVNGAVVAGGSDWVADHPDVLTVLAVGIPEFRRRVVMKLRRAGANFATVVSPVSIIGDQSSLGEGTIILPGAVVTSNVEIGDFVLLNPTVSISHDCVIGDYTSLGPGVSLAGNVKIGAGCDIGTNASAIPGARIGANSIIGAGACVVNDVPDNVTAVGVPARVMRSEDQYGGPR